MKACGKLNLCDPKMTLSLCIADTNKDEKSTANDKEADDVADKLKDMTMKETKDKAKAESSKGSGDKGSTDCSEKDQAER